MAQQFRFPGEIYNESLHLSSPRAESAELLLSNRVSQWGERLFGASDGSPQKNGRNSETKKSLLDELNTYINKESLSKAKNDTFTKKKVPRQLFGRRTFLGGKI